MAQKRKKKKPSNRTIEDGKEEVKELSPSEIKDLLHSCEGFLASGLPCPHTARYMIENQKGGGKYYCGYHK